MVKMIGLTFVMACLLTMLLKFLVIHQFGLYALVADTVPDPAAPGSSPDGLCLKAALETYGAKVRTFRHGALHGFFTGLFLVFLLLTVNSLYEQKSARCILIHGGYRTVCILLMGGIICQFA